MPGVYRGARWVVNTPGSEKTKMAKKIKRRTPEQVQRIRDHGTFFLPPGGLCNELLFAALFDIPERTVIDDFIHPPDHDGMAVVRSGCRFVFCIDEAVDYVTKHAKPHEKQRRTRCQEEEDDDPACET